MYISLFQSANARTPTRQPISSSLKVNVHPAAVQSKPRCEQVGLGIRPACIHTRCPRMMTGFATGSSGAASATLGCLALLCFLSSALSQRDDATSNGSHGHRDERLAVLLPTYDPHRDAEQWSTRCTAGTTRAQDVDLVLYVLSAAEDSNEWGYASSSSSSPFYSRWGHWGMPENDGRCFARMFIVTHNDDVEVSPKLLSVVCM